MTRIFHSEDGREVWLRATVLRTFVGVANELEAHPERFRTGRWAHDRRGNAVAPTSGAAVCWDTDGFLRRAIKDDTQRHLARRFLVEAVPEMRGNPAVPDPQIIVWSDAPGRTAADVVVAFRDAAVIVRAALDAQTEANDARAAA